MVALIKKEIAFVNLASQYLDYTKEEISAYMKLVERGAEISPHLWEMIIEKISGIKFVNQNGYDFEDYSEAKTGSLTVRFDHNKGYNTKKGRITNAANKIGYMRVAIWNEWYDSIDYFLIPPDHSCTSYSSEANPQGAIQFSYSSNNNRYSNNLQEYRHFLIEEVCQPIVKMEYTAA
jgi:hypothetical protein